MKIFAVTGIRTLMAACCLLATSVVFHPVHAQNLFSAVVRVNDKAITQFEVQQRIVLLSALRSPGNLQEVAVQRLIDERLQISAAQNAGIVVTQNEIDAGIEEFAGRANLTPDQFTQSLAAAGVAPETFRDFVSSALAWRSLVRAKFGPPAAVPDADIDREIERAFEQAGNRATARVLISELFLPANTPAAKRESESIANRITQIKTIAGFAAAAREYSIGPSRVRGGRVETWVPLTNLPAPISDALIGLRPGQVTDPFPLPNALVLFQLRAIEEIEAPAPENLSIDYAAYYLAGGLSEAGRAAAASLRARVDTCDDLYGVAKGQPEEVLERDSLPIAEIPNDIAIELAKLDPGEVSTALTRANGQTLVFLMLCSRTTEETENASREVIQQRLVNQRLTSFAESYLAELRAAARITYQ